VGRPLAVTIATEHPRIGSAETYAFSLAAELSRLGADVELLVFPEVVADARAWVAGTDTVVASVPTGTVVRLLACLKRFARRRPDVVHVNHAVSPAMLAAGLIGVPARFLTDHVLPLSPSYNARGSALRWLTRASTTDVVVFSEQNAALAPGSWGRKPIGAIPAGVPQALCARGQSGAIRGELGVSERAIVVGLVGRLANQKRPQVFVRALAQLLREGREIHGLLVGEGEERAALEGSIAALGLEASITLTGSREDVGCLLAAMDLYAQPSGYEGICFAALEAMSVGLPCVMSDLPVFRELAGDLDVPFVRVDDVQGLASAIATLMDDRDRADRAGRSLRRRWRDRYTVQRMVADHRSAYLARLGQLRRPV
jgi:glycosyltransferase involved in cell wall biosynthesis